MNTDKDPFGKRVQSRLKRLLHRPAPLERFRRRRAGHDTPATDNNDIHSPDTSNNHHAQTDPDQHEVSRDEPSKQQKRKRLPARLADRIVGLHNKIWRRNKDRKARQQHSTEKHQCEHSHDHQDQDEDELDIEDEEEEEVDQTLCGCGRPLKAGWECSSCRLVCPTCHRALGQGEQCSRCHQVSSGVGSSQSGGAAAAAAGTAPPPPSTSH